MTILYVDCPQCESTQATYVDEDAEGARTAELVCLVCSYQWRVNMA